MRKKTRKNYISTENVKEKKNEEHPEGDGSLKEREKKKKKKWIDGKEERSSRARERDTR